MGKIWKEAFEVVGDGIAVADAFYKNREAQLDVVWKAVKSFGASGYRPSYYGGIQSLFFPEAPSGYRVIGVGNEQLLECVPRKNSKAGRSLANAIAAVSPVDREDALLDSFGWPGHRPCDGYRIFHGTMTRVLLPSVRYLACLPRELDDEYVPPETLQPLAMSEYLRAFEMHNAAVAAAELAEAAE